MEKQNVHHEECRSEKCSIIIQGNYNNEYMKATYINLYKPHKHYLEQKSKLHYNSYDMIHLYKIFKNIK